MGCFETKYNPDPRVIRGIACRVYGEKPDPDIIFKSHITKFNIPDKSEKKEPNGDELEINKGKSINKEKLDNNINGIKKSIESKEENEIENSFRKQNEKVENEIKNSENSNEIYNIINSEENKDNKSKTDINDIFKAQMKNSNLNIEETDIKKSNKESEKNVNIFESNDENNSITADNRNENFGEQKTRLVKDSIYNNNWLQNPKILTTESIYKNNLSSQTIENQKNTQISNEFKSINTSIKPQLENNIGGIAKIPEEKEDKNSFDG